MFSLKNCLQFRSSFRILLQRPLKKFTISKKYCTDIKLPKMISEHLLSLETPIIYLKSEEAFAGLSEQERKYAHYLSRASWWGSTVIHSQCSPETPWIFALLTKLYRSQSYETLKATALEVGLSDDEFKSLCIYYCTFLYNMGNYLGFGDKKIIPNVSREKLEKFIKASEAYGKDSKKMDYIMKNCLSVLFDLSENKRFLGLPEKGVTMYFTENCTAEDAKLATEYMTAKNIEGWNTRFLKTEKDGKPLYEIRLASVDTDSCSLTVEHDEFKGNSFCITRGDYSPMLKKINENLEKAKEFTANDTEKSMLDKYISSFKTGSLQDHKNGSIHWVKNKSPAIETYMGFIEVYRDPTNQRAEFESFVAAVNREQSKKFDELVARAPKDFLPLLPWGPEFEEDVFKKPDYSSLDVLTFATSGLPIGINIPNYQDITENHGFKNVNLSNVISARTGLKGNPFLTTEDEDHKEKYSSVGIEISTGLHELLGHGSGKILTRRPDGTLNFDETKVMNPFTGEKASFYEIGETYQTVFSDISSAYEECRAEAVSIYLIFVDGIYDVFGIDPAIRDDVSYVVWLDMMYGGLRGLEMYQTSQQKWGQAHCQARYVLLQLGLESGVVTLEEIVGSDGLPDLNFSVDKSKIATDGRAAVGEFLKKMQIYRSTGDGKSARTMFENYSKVPAEGPHPFAKWHEIIMRKRKPRMVLTMPNTKILDDKTQLISYPSGIEGMISSWNDRFSSDEFELMENWLTAPNGSLKA